MRERRNSVAYGLRPGIVAMVALCAMLSAGVVLGSLSGPFRTVDIVVLPLSGCSFILAGILAWVRRPLNRFGGLLALAGYAILLSGYGRLPDPVTYTIGYLVILMPVALMVHALMAFPSGRLADPWSRTVVGAIYFVAVPAHIAWLMLSPHPGGGVLSRWILGCERCPPTLLSVHSAPAVARWITVAQAILVGATLIVGGAMIVARWLRRSPTVRRQTAPLVIWGILTIFVLATARYLDLIAESARTTIDVGTVGTVMAAVLPVAFLTSLLTGTFGRITNMAETLAAVEKAVVTPSELREVVAHGLGDPTVELAFWLEDRDEYVDATGNRFDLPKPGSGRAVTPVANEDETIGAIVHSEWVAEEGPRTAAVAQALTGALARVHLQARLMAATVELDASRLRIVEAADEERGRIAHDLHDGAQQQLVLLEMIADQALRDRDPAAVDASLQRIRTGARSVREDIRALIRNLAPAILSERGLMVAIDSLASNSPLRVAISGDIDRRLPDQVERAAYFVVAEALTNTIKHAHATRASVSVRDSVDRVEVAVEDDGTWAGEAAAEPHSGLSGLHDRVAAVGGRLEVTNAPDGGTAVIARFRLNDGSAT